MIGFHFNEVHAMADVVVAIVILLVFSKTLLTAYAAIKHGRVDMSAVHLRVLISWSALAVAALVTGSIFTTTSLLILASSRNIKKAAY